MLEVYATTLHYAPCSAVKGEGFRVMIALPRGTNGPKPEITPLNDEDRRLWACNKWLLAHAESAEAAAGRRRRAQGRERRHRRGHLNPFHRAKTPLNKI